jgi:hypothetical protein
MKDAADNPENPLPTITTFLFNREKVFKVELIKLNKRQVETKEFINYSVEE